jgi:hypothetical protein
MAKMKKTQLDIYDSGYTNGYYDASWECSDCGNTYDSSVKQCPNEYLDKAAFKYNNKQSHDE